jgi:hypothetical protein
MHRNMSDLITKIVSKLTQKLIPNWRHVVLVSSAKNATNSVLAFDASEIANESGKDPTN